MVVGECITRSGGGCGGGSVWMVVGDCITRREGVCVREWGSVCCFLFRHVAGSGGKPYCSAGTGKSESVKALGDLFGRQVLVFNCDETSTS